MAQVNIFSPFRRKSEHHEDRLTWGFLITLKYAPILQKFFRGLVLSHMPSNRWNYTDNWEPASISTQTNELGTEASFIVSVLLSDTYLLDNVDVKKSDRKARYDGVIKFADGLVFIIENKPRSTSVWTNQLSPSLASFQDLSEEVVLYEQVVSVEWARVLEGVLNYSGSQICTYTEKTMIRDFLSFAEDLHPKLSPYRTFRLCGKNKNALTRRIEMLLESIGDQIRAEVESRPGGQQFLQLSTRCVRQLHIIPINKSDDDELYLRQSIWPGDTVDQARAFMNTVDKKLFLELPNHGWEIRPNLHFSHVQKHLVWANTLISVEDYLDFFLINKTRIGRIQFEEESLEKMIENLRRHNLITESDELDLQSNFGETRRSYVNIIPGFQLTRDWSLSNIIDLEEKELLEAKLIDKLQIPLRTWLDELDDSL